MDNQLQLRKQIQEMDREEKVEKRINNTIKRFLKMFKQYKIVNSIDQGDVVLVFDKTNPEYFNFLLNNDEVKSFLTDNQQPRYVLVFVKNKNNHNTKLHVLSDIMSKKFYK